jgi:predicted dehydrogenase
MVILLRVGIVGAGNIANTFIDAITRGNLSICLEAIASRNLSKAKSYQEKYNIKKAYESYQELYEDDEVDLVYVATPHSFHYEQMMEILDYNKHIICEKPFTLNHKQAKMVFHKAKQKNLFVMEALWTRFLPVIKELKKLVDNKIIGEVQRVEADFCFSTDLDESHRLRNPYLGGGALLDLGIYCLSFADIFLGTPQSFETKMKKDLITGVDIDEEIIYKYKNGKVAILTSSIARDKPLLGKIYGDDGLIVVEEFHQTQKALIYNKDKKLIKTVEHQHIVNGFEYEILSAIASIEKGLLEDPHIPHSTSIKILKQMDQIRESWGFKYPSE